MKHSVMALSEKFREYSGISVAVEQPNKVVGLLLLVLAFTIPVLVLPFAFVASKRAKEQREKNVGADLALYISGTLTVIYVAISAVGLIAVVVLPALSR